MRRLAMAYLLLLPACVTTGSEPTPSRGHEVTRAPFEDVFLEILKEAEPRTAEGFALFTSGGMTDEGQILVYPLADGRALHFYVAPNSRELDQRQILSADEWEELREALAKGAELQDHEPVSFDGPSYEIVWARLASDGKAEVTRRLRYRPTPKASSDALADLVEAFQATVD